MKNEREKLKHFRALETLRADSCTLSGEQIFRKLRELERIVYACTLTACNEPMPIRVYWPIKGLRRMPEEFKFYEDFDKETDRVKERVKDCLRNIFGHVPQGVRVNWDARGAALKLDSEKVAIPEGMHQDWGKDGILAPSF